MSWCPDKFACDDGNMELFNKMIRSSRNFRGLNACCNSDDFKHFVWSLCHVVVFYDQIHIPEILSLCALE